MYCLPIITTLGSRVGDHMVVVAQRKMLPDLRYMPLISSYDIHGKRYLQIVSNNTQVKITTNHIDLTPAGSRFPLIVIGVSSNLARNGAVGNSLKPSLTAARTDGAAANSSIRSSPQEGNSDRIFCCQSARLLNKYRRKTRLFAS
ncbi:jg27808 [Pararge aegeria aegeria]|uniref:Jg27808 protein n=1 Tax=Pararge aegeria aegeria TaxID=348720 RepID=A0A8S4S3J3_9NEOP|nr:jg27808 [Pararge aegeria aegeria]